MQLFTVPEALRFECHEELFIGELLADPEFGTAIVKEGRRLAVRWQPGYFGRLVNGEVEVVGSSGFTVAVTGSQVELDGGEFPAGVWSTCLGLQ